MGSEAAAVAAPAARGRDDTVVVAVAGGRRQWSETCGADGAPAPLRVEAATPDLFPEIALAVEPLAQP